MQFEDYLKTGKVKKANSDKQLAKSLLSTAQQDFEFLEGLSITELSARKLVSNFYDILRSLLEAFACMDGFKVYSHEAFTYYLLSLKEEKLSRDFDRFRKIRNGINYYGKSIDVEEAIEVISDMKKLIAVIQKMVEVKLL